MNARQGRYKVIERGRRLVTIDTLTGTEMGQLPPPPPGLVDYAVPRKGTGMEAGRAPARAGEPGTRAGEGINAGRLAGVILAGLAFIFFLLISQLWFVVVGVVVFVPPVRKAIFSQLLPALARFVRNS